MLDAFDIQAKQVRDMMRADAADASAAAFSRERSVGAGGGGCANDAASGGSGEGTREEDGTVGGGGLAGPARVEARKVDRKRQLAVYCEFGRRNFISDRLALDVAMLERAKIIFAGAKRKREEDKVFPFKSAL